MRLGVKMRMRLRVEVGGEGEGEGEVEGQGEGPLASYTVLFFMNSTRGRKSPLDSAALRIWANVEPG